MPCICSIIIYENMIFFHFLDTLPYAKSKYLNVFLEERFFLFSIMFK